MSSLTVGSESSSARASGLQQQPAQVAAGGSPTANSDDDQTREDRQATFHRMASTVDESCLSPLPAPLLNSSVTGAVTKNVIAFDAVVFAVVFPCLLVPPIGIWAYETFIQPELVQRRSHVSKNKKTDDPDVSPPMAPSVSLASAVSLSRLRVATPPPVEPTSHFAWSWPSLVQAIRAAFTFTLPEWLVGSSDSWQVQLMGVRAVVLEEKTYLTHPHFLQVFRCAAWTLVTLITYFALVSDVELSLKDPFFYALRMYAVSVGSFAAVCSVHSEGLLSGYKAVQSERERVLDGIDMKFLTIPAVGASPGQMSESAGVSTFPPSVPAGVSRPVSFDRHRSVVDTARALSVSLAHSRLERTTALQVLKSIDSLAKVNKSVAVERRLVYVAAVCLVRATVGAYSSWCGGGGWFTSLLYLAFHFVLGFFFFGLGVLAEYELHEDERRWSVFSAIHSTDQCRAMGIPFTVPLATLGRAQNIVGWYSIRGFLKDLKVSHAQMGAVGCKTNAH